MQNNINLKMHILVTENNEYELPIAVYGSYKEMAEDMGLSYDYAIQRVSRKKTKKHKYFKVFFDEKEEEIN